MKHPDLLGTVGRTPHVRIRRLFGEEHEVWMKLERANPGGSIKDRIAVSMIEDAEGDGRLQPGSVIVEPTSGNTGVGLAMVGAIKGYRVILVMPESMSIERRRLMKAYGAELVLTPREGGMKAAIERAAELARETPGAWIPSQFDNPSNPAVHRDQTAREVLDDFPEGFDVLVTGVGTGGHISAVGRALKERFPNTRVIAVEPADSAVISGGSPGPHPIQGIGAGFLPANLDREVLDGVVAVTREEAFGFARRCAREEGILVGISTGASLAAVGRTLAEAGRPTRVLTFAYDTGERYLSVEGLFD